MNMNAMKIFLYFFGLLLIGSCSQPQINGQEVFDEVFVQVVDSTLIDRRIYLGTGYTEKQKDSIRNIPSKPVVAIDERMIIMNSDLKDIPKEYRIPEDTAAWVLHPEKFNASKYIFKKSSEIMDGPMFEKWPVQYPGFTGLLSFSKIYFDPKAENGMMAVVYSCNAGCGIGYLVYLKKTGRIWKVHRVKQTWIS
jgi:hypothetical protein